MCVCERKPYVLGRWWDGLCGLHTLVSCAHCEASSWKSQSQLACRSVQAWRLSGQKGPGVAQVQAELCLCLAFFWGGSVWCVSAPHPSGLFGQFLHQESTGSCHSVKQTVCCHSVGTEPELGHPCSMSGGEETLCLRSGGGGTTTDRQTMDGHSVVRD